MRPYMQSSHMSVIIWCLSCVSFQSMQTHEQAQPLINMFADAQNLHFSGTGSPEERVNRGRGVMMNSSRKE